MTELLGHSHGDCENGLHAHKSGFEGCRRRKVKVGPRLKKVMPRVSQIGRELTESVRIRSGRAGDRLKPAVLKN